MFLYVITGLIGMLLYRGRNAVPWFLFAFMFFSVIGAILIGYDLMGEGVISFIIAIYTCFLLFLLFNSLKGYSNFKSIDTSFVNQKSFLFLEKILGFAALLAFLIDIYILIKIFPLMLAEQLNVTEYKNQGGAVDMLDSLVPHFLITISNLFGAVGYFFLSIHFFYLVNGNIKKSIYCLMLSLILVLSRLIGLSRSALIEYAVTYAAMFFFFWPTIRVVFKRRLKVKHYIILALVLCSFIWVFSAISSSRFSSYYTKTTEKESIIDETTNPVLFSSIDYFSQWAYHNDRVISLYNLSNVVWGRYSFDQLGRWFRSKISPKSQAEDYDKKLAMALGDSNTAFIGLITALVLDFGLLGSFIFVLIMSRIIFSLSPKNGIMSFKTLLWFPLIASFVTEFWTGNMFIVLTFDIAIFYTTVWLLFIKKQKKTRKGVAVSVS